jgi:pseudouridine kinase
MNKKVLCIGATLLDELYFCEQKCLWYTSNPAQKRSSVGGVIGNIAQHLGLLQCKPSLITTLGKDSDAKFITERLTESNVDYGNSCLTDDSTGKYVSILNPDGNLVIAVSQDTSEKSINPIFLASNSNYIQTFEYIIIDTNLSKEAIQWIINFSRTHHQKLIIEPVSVLKAEKLTSLNLDGVFMITPNEEELKVLAHQDNLSETQQTQEILAQGVEIVWVRKGASGSVFYQKSDAIALGVPEINIVDSTGAGDAALAGWMFGVIQQQQIQKALQLAHTLAIEVLQINGAVNYDITPEILIEKNKKYYNE